MIRPRRSGDSGLGCREVVELVTDYLEGALTPAVRDRLEEHLRSCRNCAAYLQQLRMLVRALGRMAPPPLAPDARDELVGLYRRWIAA